MTEADIDINDPKFVRAVYDGAIEHLEKYGWVQSEVGGPEKPCCVIGALAASCAENGYYGPLLSLCDPFRRAAGVSVPAIGAWNDRKGRTKEEVIEKLKEARDSTLV